LTTLKTLLQDIRGCRECERHLPLGPRPILAAHSKSKILIIGQAPGLRVHDSGKPWDDPSGNRLRDWMQISVEDFYDERKIAIVPMGFCYPGTGTNGDLPPRPECAKLWHDRLIEKLKKIELTLVIGQYSQKYWLKQRAKSSLTKTVEAWREYLPDSLPLPHPSPRNNRWLKQNPWFEHDILPELRKRVSSVM